MKPVVPGRHHRHRLVAAAATLGFALVAGACGSAADSVTDTGETRVFVADNGEITIPMDPERIVATGYAVPALIEAGAPLVGISAWSRGLGLMTPQDRATYDNTDKVAGDAAAETDYDAVAKAQPDLIIVGVPAPVLGDLDMDRLKSIAPVVAIGPTVPSAWRELTRKQMDAAGHVDSYDEAKTAYGARAAELKAKYAGVLGELQFGHLGAHDEDPAGTFLREFGGSWGTNIAQDIGVEYYGEVEEKKGGSADVSEHPAIEEIPGSFADADAITYTLEDDGTVSPSVQYVLDSRLFENLPAVKAGKVYGLRYTEAATYPSALRTLDAIDEALAPLLTSPAGQSGGPTTTSEGS
jgi:iron complex transport system substrate-binding protein